MNEYLATVCAVTGIAAVAQPAAWAIPPDSETALRAAVQRSIAVVEKSALEYRKQRQCFSCHHQALPALLMTEAARRGFQVDRDNLRAQFDFTAESLKRGLDGYRQGHGQGGRYDTAGWALWTLQIGERTADDTTSAVAEYVLGSKDPADHWTAASQRPPTEASPFTTTYVAVRGLTAFGTSPQESKIAERRAAVLKWLAEAPAKDTEDQVFRLRTLHYLDADKEVVESAAHELLRRQRPDGGWSQTADLASDAYATGTALAALRAADKLPATDSAYRAGVKFLLKSQLPDGSWHVKTRSKPIQKFFDSGFPHDKDQFISISATCWAALAVLHTMPTDP